MEGKSQYINATLYGHYKRRSNAVHRCADAALDKGYEIFAVQDGGQCFSGADAGKKYKDNGKSSECRSMKGGPLANDVYTISKFVCLIHKSEIGLRFYVTNYFCCYKLMYKFFSYLFKVP